VCREAGDEDRAKRESTIRSTYAKHSDGEWVTGRPTLADLIGGVAVDQAQQLLDFAKEVPLRRGDQVELADLLVATLGSVVADEGQQWRYVPERGLYERIERDEQSRIVQSFAGRPVSRGKDKSVPLRIGASDVAGSIQLASHRTARKDFFANAPAGIAFADCFLALTPTGLEKRPHHEGNRARAAYPFAFDEAASPAETRALLAATFEGEADAEERIAFLQEFWGACILGVATRYQRSVVLFSEQGATGKSTTIEIGASAMPVGTTAAIPPQLWSNEYRRAQLAGVRLNSVNELPAQDIADSEAFKAIIDGASIDARAIREAPFTLRPIAGNVFATNALPSTPDVSSAFFRRLVVIKYSHVVPSDRRVPGLAALLVTRERPQLVSWLVQGAAHLLARGDFVVPRSSAEQVEAWRAHADSVSSFVTECGVATCWTSASALYRAYQLFCAASGFRSPASIRTFAHRLAALAVRKRSVSTANEYWLRPTASASGPFGGG